MADNTFARLASLRSQIPVTLGASLTFRRRNARFAFADTRDNIAGFALRTFRAFAVFAAGSRVQIPMLRRAFVAFQTDNVRLADTLTGGLFTPESEKKTRMLKRRSFIQWAQALSHKLERTYHAHRRRYRQ